MSLDLLVLAPHPDDAELSCGGWLALCADRGQRAGVVDLTAGELATNGTVEVRAAEAAAAAEVLGLALRENLGLPDGGLDASDTDQVAAVVGAIRRHRPTLLAAPWTEDRHPDHAAAGALAHRACFLAGLVRYRPELGTPHRPLRLVHYGQRHEAPASFVVDTSGAAERKARAVACHRSQLGGAPTLLNAPLGTEAFAVRDRYWGASIGTTAGEPYWIAGPVPLSDPLAHFANHPASPVLVPPR